MKASVPSGTALTDLICNLPTFRPVAVRILKVLSRDAVDFSEVTRLLEADPALCAEVLTIANSALYGGYSRINTVLRGIVVLGVTRIKSLTMTAALRAFVRNLPRSTEMTNCWSHSRACALVAEELAGAFDVAADQAYTAGLMHDVGRFGMLATFPEDYRAMLGCELQNPAVALAAEEDRFGFTHCAAGERLAATWRLPPSLSRAAAAHHGSGDDAGPVVSLTRAACRLAASFGFPSVDYRETCDVESLIASLPVAKSGVPLKAGELQARLREKFFALDLG